MRFSRQPPARAATLLGGMIRGALRDRAALAGVSEVAAFGSNPGALRMLVHARPRLRAGRPLVVVLHGCGQQAAAFAAESGWLALADELGFALLLPEQRHDNNRGRCFNWFRADDVRRGSGEAMSIRQMVRVAVARYASDRGRVFIVGFSAGAGMAAAMLAAYPAVFAAGGVVAGMPVGCAKTQVGAMLHMRRADSSRSRQALASDVRQVTRARSRKAWPRISIWQGSRDRTVDPANAEALAAQWSENPRHRAWISRRSQRARERLRRPVGGACRFVRRAPDRRLLAPGPWPRHERGRPPLNGFADARGRPRYSAAS